MKNYGGNNVQLSDDPQDLKNTIHWIWDAYDTDNSCALPKYPKPRLSNRQCLILRLNMIITVLKAENYGFAFLLFFVNSCLITFIRPSDEMSSLLALFPPALVTV